MLPTSHHFEFADKTPVKFWGTNLSYAAIVITERDSFMFSEREAVSESQHCLPVLVTPFKAAAE